MNASIRGLNINYKIIGEGKPLLILHGWGSSSDKWKRIGELLVQKGIKVIIPDLPGFGESEKPQKAWSLANYSNFVEDFVRFLNLEKLYLLGHSFGGSLAIKFGLQNPDKIAKLILVSPACIRKKSVRAKLLKFISRFFKIKNPFFRKLFYRKSDYLSVEGVMKDTYLKIIAEDLSGILSKVQVPTVIIWGNKDDITPLRDGYLIKEKIQNSRLRQGFGGQAKLEIIANVGHDINVKAPKELSSLILKELSSLEGAKLT